MSSNTQAPHTGTIKKLSPTYLILSTYFFFNGVEYAVILPTLNLYLLHLGAASFFIGIVMSAFSFTGLLSSPIYGLITDITGSTKWIVVISNLFEVTGNLLYFTAVNPYMILGSRLLAGVGSGSGSSIFGMISRCTTKQERTAAFSHLLVMRQIGLIVGPAFNLFLQKLNFNIGNFPVNPYTSPGIFMALLWVIHTLLMLIIYKEFPSMHSNDIKDEHFEEARSSAIENGTSVQHDSCEDDVTDVNTQILQRERAPSQFFTYVYNDLLREEVVLCLGVSFLLMFVQTGVETFLTPLTLQLFDWGELPNSIFYCVAGALITISFLVLAALSKKVSDRILLITGLIVMVGCYVVFVSYISFAVKAPVGSPWVITVFSIQSCLLVVSLPFVGVPQASLYSKFTSERTQGFNQGIRILMMRLGQILGPLWAGAMLNRLLILGAVNLGLISLLLVMVLSSYKKLMVDEPEPSRTESSFNASSPTERTRLLSKRNAGIQA